MKTAILILTLCMTIVFAFGCGEGTPPAPIAKEIDSAMEPSLTPGNGVAKAGAAEKTAPPFTIMVKNAFIFDASTDPFTKNITLEKGVCLIAVGSVRNDTDKILHRGGLFGTLTATFASEVKITKHTSGMGFLPAVSSQEPWRPGTWREFRLFTRALDPIYMEYTALDLEVEIVLEVRDPLNYRLRSPLTTFRLPWRTLKGAAVTGSAAVLETVIPINFEKPGTRQFQTGDLVRVSLQKGAGYKVLNEDGLGGWLPYRTLQLDLDDFRLLPAVKFPITEKSDNLTVVFERFSVTDAPEKGYKIFSAKFKVVNDNEKETISVKTVDFMFDFGPIDAPGGNLEILKEGALKSTTGWIVKSQSTDTLIYSATYPANKIPLEFVWWASPKHRIAIPLI